jgi:hypothetical protein
MSKLLAGCAGALLLCALSLPVPAGAAERRADGIHAYAGSYEMSAHRRRYVRRYWRPRYAYWGPRRYWRPRYGYWGPRYRYWGPRYGYYRPWYYRPRPAFGVYVGPFGFGAW